MNWHTKADGWGVTGSEHERAGTIMWGRPDTFSKVNYLDLHPGGCGGCVAGLIYSACSVWSSAICTLVLDYNYVSSSPRTPSRYVKPSIILRYYVWLSDCTEIRVFVRSLPGPCAVETPFFWAPVLPVISFVPSFLNQTSSSNTD